MVLCPKRMRDNWSLYRLVEQVHRDVPYPVLLISWRDGALELSLTYKRRSLREVGKTVVASDIVAAQVDGECADEPVAAFRGALALAHQPRDTLRALYQGWIDAMQALCAAQVAGAFPLPAADQEAALRECRLLDDRIEEIRVVAGKAKQMSRRVELNSEFERLQTDPDAARIGL